MLDDKTLCKHIQYMLHTPVRLYDQGGAPLISASEDREDPLDFDPAFAGYLLQMRQNEMPSLHCEAGGVIYAVIPASADRTFLMGPACYMLDTVGASHMTAMAHQLPHPDACHITYVPLDIFLESTLILFHSGSDRVISRDELTLQGDIASDHIDEAVRKSYGMIYHLRENNTSHNSYAQEVREQKAIREGNLSALRQSWSEHQDGQIGRLGKDEVTQYRNLAVVVITLACRSAIEGGVLPEFAYTLADSYTLRTGELTDPVALIGLFRSAELQFTQMVHDMSANKDQSKHVIRCKEMVHDRLHQRIQVADLAKELGLSRGYLSQLFLKEEGIRLSSYIVREKVRASEYALMHTELTLEQIATTYCFATQSHFGQAFKRYCGVTPGEYREHHLKRR